MVEAFLETERRRDGETKREPRGVRAWAPIPGLPEYGWTMQLRFEHWLRDQVRFDSVGELVEQLGRDCERVRAMIGLEARPPTDKEAACR